jgi:hypothetical protein
VEFGQAGSGAVILISAALIFHIKVVLMATSVYSILLGRANVLTGFQALVIEN